MTPRQVWSGLVIGCAVLSLSCEQAASLAEDHTESWPEAVAPCDPAAADICNGRDDDCDGAVDEDATCADPCRAVRIQDSCLLRNDGAVFCWDTHTGNPSGFYARTPVRVALDEAAVQLDAGCARMISGRVACWGGYQPQSRGPGYVTGLGNTTAAIGSTFREGHPRDLRCARRNGRRAGSLWCWAYGLGPPAEEHPQPVSGYSHSVVDIALGAMACVRTEIGEISCAPSGSDPLVLTPLAALGRDNLAVASGQHVCALKADGRVVCLGPPFCASDGVPLQGCSSRNLNGELGTGDTSPAVTPLVEAVALGSAITKLVVNDGQTCVLDGAGRVTCVGRSRFALRPRSSGESLAVPQTPPGLERDVVDLSTTCAIKRDGTVWCWGDRVPDGSGLRPHPEAVPIDFCPERTQP